MAVTYVGGTSLVETTGTSLSANAPTGLASGDLLVAAVYARSAITPPSGWTLIVDSGNFTNGTVTQRLACYKKNSTSSGDSGSSFTWTQGSSHPMGVIYAAARNSDGSPNHDVSIRNNVDSDAYGSIGLEPDAFTATADGQMMFAFASVTEPGQTQVASWDFDFSSIATSPASRMIGIYAARDNGEQGALGINLDEDFQVPAVTYGIAAIQLLIEEGTPPVDTLISDAGPLVATGPALLASVPPFAMIAAEGPLDVPTLRAWVDVSSLVDLEGASYYVMDLTTPTGDVRVPISSWQGTLQVGRAQYVQCVIPAAEQWVDQLGDATAFRISRLLGLVGGGVLSYEIAAAPLQTLNYARGATNHSATISGYATAADAIEWPPSSLRQLTGVRSMFVSASGVRVRCAIDWQLQPGMTVEADGQQFVASYVNVICGVSDSYMDVGERVAEE